MASTRRDFLRLFGGAVLGGPPALASGIENFGLVAAFAQQTTAAAIDYKALVCIFLNGGNDGNNTIVPLDGEYNGYASVRGGAGLAIPQASLLPINVGSINRSFGLHPSLAELQTLYNQQKVAVLCNVGPLVEPLTRESYRNGGGRRPLQLFSHSDQVGLWQSSIADSLSQTGWGGRMADRLAALNGAAIFPQAVSVAGISIFTSGNNTRPLAIADSRTPLNQVLPLAMSGSTGEVSARRTAYDQLRIIDLGATLVNASSETTSQAIRTSQTLMNANATLATDFPNTTLGYQLEQVARLIKMRDTLGIRRQIFFCSLGGFDTHNNQGAAIGAHANLLAQVSQAMKAFYDATAELGVADQVTTFTLSDFGRTLQPAGSGGAVGSDHAWGNHQLVMGGAVRGGDFYGTYPVLALGGPDDTDTRGRWIPTISVDQYAATLATWYGLSAADVPLVFPLIGRFPTANLGFLL